MNSVLVMICEIALSHIPLYLHIIALVFVSYAIISPLLSPTSIITISPLPKGRINSIDVNFAFTLVSSLLYSLACWYCKAPSLVLMRQNVMALGAIVVNSKFAK